MALFRKFRKKSAISQRIYQRVPESRVSLSRMERKTLLAAFPPGTKILKPIIAYIKKFPDITREELQSAYATALVANLLARAGYQVKYANLVYACPEVPMLSREHAPSARSQPADPKKSAAFSESIDKITSTPALYILPALHDGVEGDYIEVIHQPSLQEQLLTMNLDAFMQHWAERSFLVAVLGDRKKQLRVMDGRHLRFERSATQQSINFRRCMDITEAFLKVSRGELERYNEMTCASFLNYLIEQDK